jgi:hypothetical protein
VTAGWSGSIRSSTRFSSATAKSALFPNLENGCFYSNQTGRGPISKVNDEVAVGSDLEFQRKWWRFTHAIWIVFAVMVVADLLGCFGRGPLANAHLRIQDGTMNIKYERIERFSTPSILRIQFGQNAIHDGKLQLWVDESLVKPLGNQRVIPQPLTSAVGQGGVLYTFAVTTLPVSVEFALEPAAPGIYETSLQVPGAEKASLLIFVMP